VNEEATLARQRQEPSRITGEVGSTAWATSSQHEWTPDQLPHDRFMFGFVSTQTGVARRCRSIPPVSVDAAEVIADHATLDSFPRAEHMWFIIGVLVGLTATAIFSRLNVPVVHAANLGWVSEQWLDEHRASRAA
jgi:hypothetical protein